MANSATSLYVNRASVQGIWKDRTVFMLEAALPPSILACKVEVQTCYTTRAQTKESILWQRSPARSQALFLPTSMLRPVATNVSYC